MKSYWTLFGALGLFVALIAFSGGAISVYNSPFDASDVTPHGPVEYWFHRYQTLLAGAVALVSAAFIFLQMGVQKDLHRSQLRFALRNEYAEVDLALAVAQLAGTVKLTTHKGKFSASTLGGIALEEFPLSLVEKLSHSDEIGFSEFAKIIERGISGYADTISKRDNPLYASMSNFRLRGYAEAVQTTGRELSQVAMRKRNELDRLVK